MSYIVLTYHVISCLQLSFFVCQRNARHICTVYIYAVCHVFLTSIFRKTKKGQKGLNSWHLRVIRCSGERAENQLLGFACTSCATCMVLCTKLLDNSNPGQNHGFCFSVHMLTMLEDVWPFLLRTARVQTPWLCAFTLANCSGYLHWWWIRRPNSWVSRSHCLCHG